VLASEITALIVRYGYAAALLGILCEGETFLVLAAIAAHEGYLEPAAVFGIGAAGAALSDNFFFALGRSFGPSLLARFPRAAGAAARANALLERFPRLAIIAMRFLYGTRTAGPAVIGAGTVPWPHYLALDALAALMWSAVWTGFGYALGAAAARLLEPIQELAPWALLLVAGGAVATLWRRRR
jgi:membrane protein DedA with SNARE-associated domain